MTVFSKLAGSFSEAVSTLTASGLTAAQAEGAVSSLFGSELKTVTPMLTIMLDNYTDAKVLSDEAVKIKETSGWPSAASPFLDQIVASAGNLGAIMQNITFIKQELQSA